MAMSCPVRKDIIRDRKADAMRREQEERPWAEVVKKTAEATCKKGEGNHSTNGRRNGHDSTHHDHGCTCPQLH